MSYLITETGWGAAKAEVQPVAVASFAAIVARALMRSLAVAAPLMAEDFNEALEFWTEEQINEDLVSAGRCDININGGYYCISIAKEVVSA